MRMRWLDLLFAHWPVPVDALRPVVPASLDIDTFEGTAYLGIVPFRMEDVAPRWLPALPLIGAFPEVNVRTYVRRGDLGGVWFLSLDAASRVAVEGARFGFHLPYFHAAMSVRRDGDAVEYRSERRDDRGPPASLDVRYGPIGPRSIAPAGSLEAWLTDRLRVFAIDDGGRLLRTEIRHDPWPLRPAQATFRVESMAAAHGLRLPDEPPHLCFADRLDVLAWWPRRA